MGSFRTWSDIDELAFHENAIALEVLARSQAPHLNGPTSLKKNDVATIAWARHFLDDFALVAAGPGEACNISAACLELSQPEESTLTVRVAKNEDFNANARQRLSEVIQVMNLVRQRGM